MSDQQPKKIVGRSLTPNGTITIMPGVDRLPWAIFGLSLSLLLLVTVYWFFWIMGAFA